ncbi:probable acyl-[acyl-carrier-protein]--UDP-N-acetylglucosamine O-acyltransferase, mitochondrial isoform X4 [Ananas comosus]|uniref:Probable acyl-[acyl-carrier-protein]--UDP-N-acetylglucosamine O-acyltransferase, mitochondrial isoform X4 n=1 Tax=Ananas comosus TaxID=4615 RepID=A0A6P5FSD4_ANACO|nr:probable acyl-[acyl-carrier-protein]--UDP-N-acetylglucosamine O-acyltransferase, mitochondrial isoform X4 [Ananas comosus]
MAMAAASSSLRSLRALSISRALSPLPLLRGFALRLLHQGVLEEGRRGGPGSVHPTAVVHADAMIGQNLKLSGSGAIVGADLPGQTIIGSNNVIGHHSVVGVRCQDLKYEAGDKCFLHIGHNNDIREYSSIHRSSTSSDKTVVGDNNLIMGSCHIAHDCKIGNNNIFANNTLLAGHVVVEDYAHTGGAVVVHQFCRIGSYSFLSGGSAISQDVPKYMMVSGDRAELRGLNLVGLQRNGFSSVEVMKMRRAYRKIFMPINTNMGQFDDRLAEVEQDKELAECPAVLSMLQSIRGSFEQDRRGICKFRNWCGS